MRVYSVGAVGGLTVGATVGWLPVSSWLSVSGLSVRLCVGDWLSVSGDGSSVGGMSVGGLSIGGWGSIGGNRLCIWLRVSVGGDGLAVGTVAVSGRCGAIGWLLRSSTKVPRQLLRALLSRSKAVQRATEGTGAEETLESKTWSELLSECAVVELVLERVTTEGWELGAVILLLFYCFYGVALGFELLVVTVDLEATLSLSLVVHLELFIILGLDTDLSVTSVLELGDVFLLSSVLRFGTSLKFIIHFRLSWSLNFSAIFDVSLHLEFAIVSISVVSKIHVSIVSSIFIDGARVLFIPVGRVSIVSSVLVDRVGVAVVEDLVDLVLCLISIVDFIFID